MAPNLNTNHWKPDIETLKVQYGEKLLLIKPYRGLILGPPGLWAGAVGSRHSSTCGYHFIVSVVFILITHYLLCPTYMSVMRDALGNGCKALEARNISALFTVFYLV